MTARRKTRVRKAKLAFDALSIEGGLISPEWLSRLAQLNAGMQSESDYRVPKGLSIRDEIGRYWRIAQAYWRDFAAGRAANADDRALTLRLVESLLRECFGFSSLAQVEPIVIAEHSYPIGLAALEGRVPIVIVAGDNGLDALSSALGDNGRKRSAFGLAQEFLNACEDAMWGIASDGVSLRILRDNASLTRPAWIEVDLQRILSEDRYADFAAFWLLVHETRFGREGSPSSDCALETWRNAGREEGTRAREHLRRGVEDALVALGQGFIAHAENSEIRAKLQSGELNTKAYFGQLLRLVYRLIFLLTVEERGLLHPKNADESARSLYEHGYSLRRLRDRSVKRSAHDRFSDLWEGAKVVFKGLAGRERLLGLPALAGLFAKDMCSALESARIENQALLHAVFKLAWLREDSGLARVNWRDMGPEELGSVYESLLELVPQVSVERRQFSFATGGETKGNARKSSGSYYTPDSLVQVLLDSALDPVIADAISRNPGKPVDALLELSIVDPACGSGHFLLAAARRLAAQVARLQAEGTPSAAEYRAALRQVVGRCIFGVDLNPMAVELCKVSLWMEAVDPGLPLTFLDSHIQHGNALLGTTPELMAKGIPDRAWDPIEGDDKKTASALKKRNKAAAAGQGSLDTLFAAVSDPTADIIERAMAALEAAPDTSPEALAQKETKWGEVLRSEEYRQRKFVADAWCAAFVWPKQPGELATAAPTVDVWRQIRDGCGRASQRTVVTVDEMVQQYCFFHWHLQFPRIFAKGGFDVVLGNPPWERVKLQEQEFFASRSAEIADAANAASRKKLIAKLFELNPQLWAEWCIESRAAEGWSHFIRQSGRYPLCGRGDINTFAIFAELNRTNLSSKGRAGFIVPAGIATDDTTKEFFQTIVDSHQISSLYHFENEAKIFPGVHHAFRFILLSLDGSGNSQRPKLLFFARSIADVSDKERIFSLEAEDFETLNPNTKTCPTFRSRRDADINLAIYRRAGVLWRETDAVDGNPWGLRFMAMLHMANDSGLFKSRAELESDGAVLSGNRFSIGSETYVPLIEAKMVHHFDHRFGTYENQTAEQDNQGKLPELDDAAHQDANRLTLPYYWVEESEVSGRVSERWSRGWLLGWRDITGTANQRTTVASLIPLSACGDAFLLAMPAVPFELITCLYASLCSFVLDYASRQKVGGNHLKYNVFRQLPVLKPEKYESAAWCSGKLSREWILPRVLELAYTAWDLQLFAKDLGYHGGPFRWDTNRRFLLRCELDAAFFHLYGLSRDETDYVLNTFPLVLKRDERAHGEYRTKRVILEIYDAMTTAARSGTPYKTRLDPPPADPSLAHPDTSRRST